MSACLRIFTPSEDKSSGEPPKFRRHKLPDFLRADDWERLVSAAKAEAERKQVPSKHKAALRDEMAVHLALYCGLRISEICNLDIEDIHLAERRLFVYQGKGGKDRFIAVPSGLIERLRNWIEGKDSGPMFVTQEGRGRKRCKRLGVRTLSWRLNKLGRIAGLTKHLHAHLMRHSYAMKLLSTGADVRQIQYLLGHSALSTTATYLHCDTSRLQETVERL